jgi:cation diffusion facilitator family transporter
MVVEVFVGWSSGSMALLADGIHMGTHVFALGITVFAYRFAQRNQDNPAFTFGTGKVGSLAGFASSIILGLVAVGMVWESVSRLIHPTGIQFGQAFAVACIGLVVNLLCAAVLQSPGTPGTADRHDHHHGHDHGNHHHDHNLRAAFLHIMADALTSLTAMAALLCVRFWNLNWMDPAIGIVGAVVIAVWAVGLLRETGRMLLDAGVDANTVAKIRATIESDSDNQVSDLHVWSLGGGALSVAVSVVTHNPRPAAHYRQLLAPLNQIHHATIEVIACDEEHGRQSFVKTNVKDHQT